MSEKPKIELTDAVANDLAIDRSNLEYELLHQPIRQHKYVMLLIKARRKVRESQDTLAKILRQKYRYYGGYAKESAPEALDKAAMKIHVETDPDYLAAKNQVEHYKETVLYLESVVDQFRSRGFTLKNIIELRKLEAGY